MNKNILILSSSPRAGSNSDELCEKFAEGALKSGNTVEKICLRDKNIGMCLGCEVCHENGGNCVQKDDMAQILEKMISSDVIVLATPVYFYTMSAQLKALIDRTVAQYTYIRGKEFYYIITAADTEKSNLSATVESIRGFTLSCLEGTIEKGIIYGTGLWKKGEAKSSKYMEQAYLSGLNC